MPFKISESENDIPDGSYVAILEKVEEGGQQKFGPTRKWYFIADVNGVGTPISAMTSENTGPASKAYKWLAAILGRPLLAGEEIQEPVGQRVVIKIEHNEKGFPKITELSQYVDPQQVIPGVPR